MLTPAECHEQSQLVRRLAEDETDPHLKIRLAQHAVALDELAMKIERSEALQEEVAG